MNLLLKSLLTSPIFEPLWPTLHRFVDNNHLPSIAEMNNLLSIENIRFVPQGPKSTDFEQGYEPQIYLRGEIQTREQNWHDFFNALVWHQFPNTKKIINQIHFDSQKKRYPQKNRLPAENMLTLFDENGAIVISKTPHLLELIQQHRWHELFWQRRDEVAEQLQVIIIGHGLYEKAVTPYIGLTAQTLLFLDNDATDADRLIMQYLDSRGTNLDTSVLHPLPLLGLPGWWPENENEQFYSNKSYFRD